MNKKGKQRPDHIGAQRSAFEKNKKKLLKLQPEPCPLCGMAIDYSLHYPSAGAPTIDHVIPIDRGGHPSDITNLQVVHAVCNEKKSNKLQSGKFVGNPDVIPNNILPLSIDWKNYRSDDDE